MTDNRKEPEHDSGATRMNATAALRERAKRLRDKADMFEKLADEIAGDLSDEADLALWSLVMSITQ